MESLLEGSDPGGKEGKVQIRHAKAKACQSPRDGMLWVVRVTEESLCKRPLKLTHFTERMQQQVTHAVPDAGHKVAASHSHSSSQPLQGKRTERSGLQKNWEHLVLTTLSGWPFLGFLDEQFKAMNNIYHSLSLVHCANSPYPQRSDKISGL